MSDAIEFQTDVNVEHSSELTGTSLWAALVRRKWLVWVSSILALVMGYLYYSKQQPVFESVARVLVTRITPVPIQQDPTAPSRDTSATLTTQTMLIRSPLVVGPAVQGTKPSSRDKSVETLVEKIEQETGKRIDHDAGSSRATAPTDLRSLTTLAGSVDPVANVIGGLTVHQTGLTSEVLELRYRCSHNGDCRSILDAVVFSYQMFLRNTRHSITKETIDLIEKAKRELSQDLAKIEEDYHDFRRENGHLLFKSADGQNMHQARQAAIELARSEVLVQRSQVKAQLGSLSKAIEDGADRDSLLLLIEKTDSTSQAIAKTDEAIRSIRLTSPESIALSRKIELLDRKLQQLRQKTTLVESDVGRTEQYIQIAQGNLAATRLKLDSIDETAKQIKQSEKSVSQFERDLQHIDANLKAVDDLEKRLNDPQAGTAFIDRELLPLLQEEQRLVDRFGSEHPDVISIRRRIELTRGVISETQVAERRNKLLNERKSLNDLRATARENITAAKEEFANYTAEYELLVRDRPKCEQQIASYQSEIATLEKERDGYRDERMKLRDESDSIEADRTVAESKLAEMEEARAKEEEKLRVVAAADAKKRNELENSNSDILTIYLGSLEQQITTLDSKASELDKLFDEEQQKSKNLESLEVADETFHNAMARKQQLFDLVVERLEKVNLTEDLGGYDATVVSHAARGHQVEPSFSRIMLFAALWGLVCGCGLAYGINLADKKFRSPSDIQLGLGLNVLGHIPVIPVEGAASENLDSKIDPIVCTYHRPASMLAECYRSVRTALFFGARGEELKVLQVTSPTPGDGKSSLSSNLAVSIAQSGKKVLLIDADFRKPRIQKIFGLAQDVGLSSVIEGTVTPGAAMQTCEVENLLVLTTGPQPGNPSEMLSSLRFAGLIKKLRGVMDYVIIDTPPVLAVTDPCNVAPRVDGVLFVLMLTNESRENARRTKELLDSVGARSLGIVVNRVGGKTAFGYGGVGYSYNDRGYRYNGYGNGYAGYGEDVETKSTPADGVSNRNGNGLSNHRTNNGEIRNNSTSNHRDENQ